MKRINIILTLSLSLGLLSSCSLAPKEIVNESKLRKAAMMSCVGKFLDKDVAPMDSLGICTTVYSRWNESQASKRGFTMEAKGEKN